MSCGSPSNTGPRSTTSFHRYNFGCCGGSVIALHVRVGVEASSLTSPTSSTAPRSLLYPPRTMHGKCIPPFMDRRSRPCGYYRGEGRRRDAALTVDRYRMPRGAVLKDLTRRSDARGLLQACGFLLLFLATTTIAFLLFRAHLWVPILFCFLTWNNPIHFRASHVLHHQFTVIRGTDKEIAQGPVAEKLNWKNAIFWFTFDLSAFFRFFGRNLLHAAGDGGADVFHWDALFPEDDPRRRRQTRTP